MTRPANAAGTMFEPYGLSAFTVEPKSDGDRPDDQRQFPHHTHLEVEIHFVESGAITLDHAGRDERLTAGELLAFWGGIPHRDVDPEPGTVYHVAQVPIVNVLKWIESRAVLDRLLSGQLLKSAASPVDAAVDKLTFGRWTSDLASGDARLRTVAELEVQARLIRLLHTASSTKPLLARGDGTTTAELVALAIQYVTRHFMEHITVDDIATAVGRNHDHLMTSFRRICGLTLWDYVTRLRLSEAQRLLTATTLPVQAICHRSGFSSTSRMYDVFHRYCQETPAGYRERMTRSL